MATETKPQDNTAALAADPDVVTPRIALGETGFNGLHTQNGRIYSDEQRAFLYPTFYRTIGEMRSDVVIASAFNVYRNFLSLVEWNVEYPKDATEEDKARAKFIDSLKDDMDISWSAFISDAFSFLDYGHAVTEKVFRRRLNKNGSRFNDGKIGLKKLSPRAQDTIEKWEFTEDGRELIAVHQSLRNLEHGALFMSATNDEGLIPIKREKFLLFTSNATQGNPQGTSILKGVYRAWKEMRLLIEQEMVGIAKEAAGLPLIEIPAEYLDPAASDDKKAVYKGFVTMLDNLSQGTNRGIISPREFNPEGKEMFKISLLEKKAPATGGLDQVIRRKADEILAALSVDILKNNNAGALSLADSDTNIIALAMGQKLKEIADVLNHDLIPQIFRLNGWSLERLPKFAPSDISSMSADELGKLMQRTASVGVVVKDIATVNRIRDAMGVEAIPEDTKIEDLEFTMESSNSGEGMETPFDGTAKKPNGKDNSAGNNENAS